MNYHNLIIAINAHEAHLFEFDIETSRFDWIVTNSNKLPFK